MAVRLLLTWLLAMRLLAVSERVTASAPGPVPPPAPREAARQHSPGAAFVGLGSVYPDVQTVDDIPQVCRGKYVKDGALAVPIVGIGVKVISITSLDLTESTFKADFNVNVAWVGASTDMPSIQFYNIVEEIEREPSDPEPKKALSDGSTDWSFYYRVRIRGVFRQVYELQRFPFDTQHLRVDVRLKSSCKLAPLRWGLDGEAFTYDKRAVHDEFTLVGANISHTYLPSYKFGRLDGYDPEAAITFRVRRKPTYWVVSYGAVASGICTLMACTYAIEADSVSDRLGVAMTLVLTMVATLYLMQENLPAVSYCTLLDYHILVCCLALTFLTLEIGTTKFQNRKAELEQKWLPRIGALWIAYHLSIIVWIGIWG